jgi:hypothetical protein
MFSFCNSSPSGGLRTEEVVDTLGFRGVTSEEERDCFLLSGYRESEPGECSLGETLESLVPLHREVVTPLSIPTYQGRNVLKFMELWSFRAVRKVWWGSWDFDFSWSKGLGFETSPIKTRSACKKSIGSLHVPDSLTSLLLTMGRLEA